jgi:hypothetical protein
MDVKSMDRGRGTYKETTTNRAVRVAVSYCGHWHGSGDERSKIAIVVMALPFRALQSTLMTKFLREYAWRRGGTM